MLNARKTLEQMFTHYADSHPLKKYLRDHCMHLLVEPKGNTGIPKSTFSLSNWDNTKRLPDVYNADITQGLTQFSGTYAIYSDVSHNFCIGSTTDYVMRLKNHYADSLNPSLADRALYSEISRVGGWHHLRWKPIVNVPNYYLEFIKEHLDYTNDYPVFRVLQTFTQYEARIFEQAIQSYLQPKLNGPGDVTFTTVWNANDIRPSLLGERSFIAVTERGKEIQFSSMSSAVNVLGTSRKTIMTVINYHDSYVDCPSINARARF